MKRKENSDWARPERKREERLQEEMNRERKRTDSGREREESKDRWR